MTRPIKPELVFPKWNPQRITQKRFQNSDFKTRYKAIRNSSSSFIKRKDVRESIFSRDGHKCVICGSVAGLEIDHIVSVYQAAIGQFDVANLNSYENLQTLCFLCNSAKKP